MKSCKLILLSLVFLLFASDAFAQKVRVIPDGGGKIRVDGALKEWKGVRFSKVHPQLRYAMVFSDKGLHIAAEIRDEMIYIKRGARPADAVLVYIADDKGHKTYRLYPGDARHAATMLRGAREISDGQIVEARTKFGLGLEAFIPSHYLSGSPKNWRMAIAYQDVDSARDDGTIYASVDWPPNPKKVPYAAMDGELPHLELADVRTELGGMSVKFKSKGDVAEGKEKEQVIVAGDRLAVFGRGYRQGTKYDFAQLPVSAKSIQSLKLKDVNGDKKREAVLRYKIEHGGNLHEIIDVFAFSGGVKRIFAAEVARKGAWGDAKMKLKMKRGELKLLGTSKNAEGVAPFAADEFVPLMHARSPHVMKRFVWKGQKFVLAESEAREVEEAPVAQKPTRSAAVEQTSGWSEKSARAQIEAQVGRKADVALSVNVLGDKREELILRFGSNLVIAGPTFRGGQGYFTFSSPTGNMRDFRVKDLTRDGRAEILFKGEMQSGDVTRRVLFVYRFRKGKFARALALEVLRTQGKNSLARKIKYRSNGEICVQAKAKGWNAGNWPWGDESGDIHVEPLPWKKKKACFKVQ